MRVLTSDSFPFAAYNLFNRRYGVHVTSDAKLALKMETTTFTAAAHVRSCPRERVNAAEKRVRREQRMFMRHRPDNTYRSRISFPDCDYCYLQFELVSQPRGRIQDDSSTDDRRVIESLVCFFASYRGASCRRSYHRRYKRPISNAARKDSREPRHEKEDRA